MILVSDSNFNLKFVDVKTLDKASSSVVNLATARTI